MKQLSVYIVEDVKEVREGLRYLLSLDGEINVTAAFSSAEDLISDLSGGGRADVILMDIGLPGMDGIDATKIVKENYPEISVLILTIFGEHEKIIRAVKAGASGYVLKNTKPTQLSDQIKSIKAGGTPISPEAASKLFDEFKKDEKITLPGDEAGIYNLTAREKEILKSIANGYTYKEIADIFKISSATVKKHILHIYRKLDVSSKVEFMKKVINENLL
ncbi:MAG: response regulator transcription factor [Spirochaetia bacterium]|nr:response regulator transcription factor [Spirochaetia bacterium]